MAGSENHKDATQEILFQSFTHVNFNYVLNLSKMTPMGSRCLILGTSAGQKDRAYYISPEYFNKVVGLVKHVQCPQLVKSKNSQW